MPFSRRVVRSLVAVAMVLGVMVGVQFTIAKHASPARANPPTGLAGEFTPAQGTVLDTRTGAGVQPSGATGPVTANQWYKVVMAGVAGIPASGVSSVQIVVTALSPAATGYVSAEAYGTSTQAGAPAPVAALLYTGGAGNISSTSIVPVDSGSNIEVAATSSTQLHIDVQGYYTIGNGTTAPGGYVAVSPARIVDTRTGTGLPHAKLAVNSTSTIQVGGQGGVPADASAVFAMITVINTSNASTGYYTAYPTGTSQPASVSTSYTASTETTSGTAVGLGGSGQFSFKVGPNGGSIDLAVDVIGYYTATSSASGAFTPQDQRVYDTRVAPAVSLPANTGRQVQVSGQNGIPLPPTGVSAYAVNAQVIVHNGTGSGYLAVGATSSSTDTTVYFPSGTSTRNSLLATRAADDGTVYLLNTSPNPIDVVLDVEGFYEANNALPQLSGPGCFWSGTISGSQPLSHQLTDAASMSVNPVSGNLLLTGTLLHLRGVQQDLSIGWRYNDRNDTRPTITVGLYEMALQPWTDGSFVYTAPDGSCYRFNQTSSTSWATPAGINATLTSPSAGYMSLRFNPSGISNVYQFANGVWVLRHSDDKNKNNPNLISYSYANNLLSSITDTQGRVVNLAYTDPNNNLQPSTITDTSLNRTISLTYGGPSGALSQITDAAGAHTNLTYDANGLSRFTDANGHVTYFDYDTTDRIWHWKYGYGSATNQVTHQSDESDWSISYDSATQTTITDGNTNASTYAIDSNGRVTSITDAKGNHEDSHWNTHNDVDFQTTSLGDQTSYVYGSTGNVNNMISKATSPNGTTGGTTTGGASQSLTFPGTSTGQITDYEASGTTDSQGNTSAIGYDSNTHQPNSQTFTSAPNAQHQTTAMGSVSSTIQGDSAGTNCGAKNGETCTTKDANGNTTSYAYDTSGNVTTITPPAPLGARAYTYDAAGRVHSATDGRGNTAYYTYDNDDRTTQISYSASSCPAATCVSYAFDGTGNLTSRTSASETTTFSYDALNRPQYKKRGSATLSAAGYDQASNLVSYTDASGTVAYAYDTANQLVSLAEPNGSCGTNPGTNPAPNSTKCTYFQHDRDNRRTAVIYPSGQSIVLGYDDASRVTSIKATTYNATPPDNPPTPGYGTLLASTSYVYATAAGGGDQALRASMTSDTAGTTTYTYDGKNRLASAAIGGTTTSWTYDNNGNRLSAAVTTGTSTTTTYSAYNAADEICWTSTAAAAASTPCTSPPAGATTYGFDASGNQTGDALSGVAATNSFNVFNQVVTTNVTGIGAQNSSYTDTSNTERLSAGATSFLNGTLGMSSQTTSGTTITFIRDPFGNLIALHDANGSHYYTTDAQGSVILLTNASQAIDAKYTYDPWGNPTSATGTYATINPWRYAGGYLDGTGYTKLGARYYNPTTGRFTQPDPSHQEANNYVYAGSNPVSNVDPNGLDLFDSITAGIGEVAGLGATVADGLGQPEVGGVLGGIASAASTVKAVGDCTGLGGDACGPAVGAALISVSTFGTSQGLSHVGEDTAALGFDLASNGNDALDFSGAYGG